MSDDTLICVENVSKKFCRSLKRSLWYGVRDIGSELLLGRNDHQGTLRHGEFWSVKDVSFEVKRGECLGLIGPNGAGKSTLLKMLNGLIKPDTGRITMRGRVGALIELGTGFNPILTGRENIYNNAAVLGMGRREVNKKLDEIIDFAELPDEALDAPVQTYSSGMKVRLGFAVAAHMRPDILLIDEVLAVGDAGFRGKCYNAISSISENSAVIFVSHHMPHVCRLSKRAIVLEEGKNKFIGQAAIAINHYYEVFASSFQTLTSGNGDINILNVRVLDDYGYDLENIPFGTSVNFHIQIEANKDLPHFVINAVFLTMSEDVVAECGNYMTSQRLSCTSGNRYECKIRVDPFTLTPAVYRMSIVLASPDKDTIYHWIQNHSTIRVVGKRTTNAAQQFIPFVHMSQPITEHAS